jgi:MFS transporter, NNP family, nitrate/nitrite transporter
MPTDFSRVRPAHQQAALWMGTLSFTVSFAVWTIFSIIGLKIKEQLSLNDTEFGLLVAMPILTGSLIRIFLGVWTEQFGGRIVFFGVMVAGAISAWLLTTADSYLGFLFAALCVGIVGGSFTVVITYVSKWFPKEKQGTALGIVGAGNIGAAVTKMLAPLVMVTYGWEGVAKIWAVALAVMAVIFLFTTKDEPDLVERKAKGVKAMPFMEQMQPLKELRVWRFSLYYFFVFGAFVALALWLPRYLVGAYGLDLKTAGLIAAAYSIPASLFRIVGGWASDKYGARKVMYWTFIGSVICTFLLSYPATTYVVQGVKGPIEFTLALTLVPFTVLVFTLGFFMSLGKAAVYKHIPVYYPDNVGSVAGVVGMIGGLGGFILPIVFGALNDLLGVWTSCFMLLFLLVSIALTWMHFAIRRMDEARHPALRRDTDLPEVMQGAGAATPR